MSMEVYWGYLDHENIIRLKKYKSDKEIQNCEQMPFCQGIFEPFYALNKEDALFKIKKFIDENKYYKKNTQ